MRPYQGAQASLASLGALDYTATWVALGRGTQGQGPGQTQRVRDSPSTRVRGAPKTIPESTKKAQLPRY